MKQKIQKTLSNGYTVAELLTVITIIGILAAIAIVSYNGTQQKARDASVLSDLDALDGLETHYSQKNGFVALAYYSGKDSAGSEALGFKPSAGNVIDVVVSGSEYCIRGYNMGGTKNSITNSYSKESSTGICNTLSASASALSD